MACGDNALPSEKHFIKNVCREFEGMVKPREKGREGHREVQELGTTSEFRGNSLAAEMPKALCGGWHIGIGGREMRSKLSPKPQDSPSSLRGHSDALDLEKKND